MTSFSITVNTLMGINFNIDVTSHDTVEMLKYRIGYQEDLNPQQQHIVLGVRELGNEEMLSQVGLKEGSTVKLVLGLRGGPLEMRRVAQPKPTEDMNGGLLVTREGMFYVKFNDMEDPDYTGPEFHVVLPFDEEEEDEDSSPSETPISKEIDREYEDNSFLPPISQTAFQETANRIKAEVLLGSNNYSYSGQLPYSYAQLTKYVRAKLYLMKDEEKQNRDRRSNVVLYSSDSDDSSTPPNYLLEPFTFPSIESKIIHKEEPSKENLERSNLQSARGRKSGVSEKKSPRPDTAGKKQIRCAECKKKLGLVTRYQCHCGKTFCSLHRYAETHTCTYDYKEEGRRLMRELIPKLPSIHRVTHF